MSEVVLKMRVDKFLNAVNITKRRAISEDMCKSGVVSVNGVVAKPSREVKVADEISITFLKGVQKWRVLAIPQSKNVPKNRQNEFVSLVEQEA